MNAEWRSRYELAIEAAQQAGRLAMGHFEGRLEILTKDDDTPVTVADRSAEQLLRTAIKAAFPDDGMLGEEYGDQPGTSGYRWIIDPIDGTKSFIRGIPLWGTLVGVEYRDETIIGVAVAPALGQTWYALRGDGAYRDGRRLRVSEAATVPEAHMAYSSSLWFADAGAEEQFLTLTRSTARQRGYGDFYGFVLVAQGSVDIMIDHGCHIWDLAALKPIVEEAGGRFTTWDGTSDIHRTDVLATNGKVHDEVLAILPCSTPVG